MGEDPRKHAVVLSGGAAYGAYEVGVLKALLTGQSPTTGCKPLTPDIVTGTSVGAFNASFLVSRLAAGGAAAAADIERLWCDRIAQGPGQCGNGVFRFRLDPQEYLTPGCYFPNPLAPLLETAQDTLYLAEQTVARTFSFLRSQGPPIERAIDELYLGAFFDTEPFDQLIRDSIDFAAVRRSQVDLQIFATNYNTSRCHRFSNADLTPDIADRAVQASGAVPTLFPPVKIDGEIYVDGALLINTPISPAIRAGADVIHVIFLDPLVATTPLRVPIATTDEIFRSLSILFAQQVRNQIIQVDQVNRSLRLLKQVALGEIPVREQETGDDRAFMNVAARLYDRILEDSPYRPLDIFIYRPSPEILGGLLGFLDFELSNVEALIAAGFADAVRHPKQPDTSELKPLQGFD